jgi:1-acyl-sn-glycerol-3-phosphate acyltransferase
MRVVGRENLPAVGPAVLVANHVSFVDWLIVASACPRPVRFVMHHGFLRLRLVGWLFRDAKVILFASARESTETLRAAYDRIAEELEAGAMVCIFPEGAVTRDGRLAVRPYGSCLWHSRGCGAGSSAAAAATPCHGRSGASGRASRW